MIAKVFINNCEQPVLKLGKNEFILTNGFQLHKALQELRSLNTNLNIEFENFNQFKKLVEKVSNRVSEMARRESEE